MGYHNDCTYNCGGTGCTGLELTSGTWSESIDCEHANGVYITVKFWIFSKTVFVCTDCCEQVDKSD